MMPLMRPARRRPPRRWCGRRHLGRRRPARRPGRVRRLLLRPPEVLRLRRRAVGGPAVARGRRPGPAHRGVGPLGARRRSTSGIALDNSRPGPDLQHAGAGHAVADGGPGGLDAGKRGPRVGARPLRPLGRDAVRVGVERSAYAHSIRRQAGRPQHRRRHHRPGPGRGERCRGVPRRCGPTGSWTPSRTASWGATSCGSVCSPTSTPPMSRHSPVHRLRGGPPGLTRLAWGAAAQALTARDLKCPPGALWRLGATFCGGWMFCVGMAVGRLGCQGSPVM